MFSLKIIAINKRGRPEISPETIPAKSIHKYPIYRAHGRGDIVSIQDQLTDQIWKELDAIYPENNRPHNHEIARQLAIYTCENEKINCGLNKSSHGWVFIPKLFLNNPKEINRILISQNASDLIICEKEIESPPTTAPVVYTKPDKPFQQISAEDYIKTQVDALIGSLSDEQKKQINADKINSLITSQTHRGAIRLEVIRRLEAESKPPKPTVSETKTTEIKPIKFAKLLETWDSTIAIAQIILSPHLILNEGETLLDCLPQILELIDHKNKDIQITALMVVGYISSSEHYHETISEALYKFDKLLRKNDPDIQRAACHILSYLAQQYPEKSKHLIPSLIRLLDSPDKDVQHGCSISVGYLARQYPVEVSEAMDPRKLLALFENNDPSVQMVLRWIMACLSPDRNCYEKALDKLLKSPVLDQRIDTWDDQHLPEMTAQADIVVAMAQFSANPHYHKKIAKKIPFLLTKLHAEEYRARRNAMFAISHLAINPIYHEQLAPGIPKMMEFLYYDFDPDCKDGVKAAIRNFSQVPEYKAIVQEAMREAHKNAKLPH